jgi:Epidermal patterning factor proteins
VPELYLSPLLRYRFYPNLSSWLIFNFHHICFFFPFELFWLKFNLMKSQGVMMEDKTRLGSIPPSCHNCCNTCNPCTAVQVPSLSGPGNQLVRTSAKDMPFSMYSNYKPLGWKCRCGDQLFNPWTRCLKRWNLVILVFGERQVYLPLLLVVFFLFIFSVLLLFFPNTLIFFSSSKMLLVC